MEEKKTSRLSFWQKHGKMISFFLVIAASIVFYFIMYRMSWISEAIGKVIKAFQPVLFGLAIAYLLNPAMRFFERHLTKLLEKKIRRHTEKIPGRARNLSILICILLLLSILTFLGVMIIPQLISTLSGMVEELPLRIQEFMRWVENLSFNNVILDEYLQKILIGASDAIKSWISTDLFAIVQDSLSGVVDAFGVIFNLVLGIVISIYTLKSKETFIAQIKKLLYATMKKEKVDLIRNIAGKGHKIFGGAVTGKLLDSCILGIICFIGLSILRIPYALLVSVIVGVTNVIPFLGPFIGAVPSAIIIFFEEPVKGIYFLVFIILLQQFDCNYLDPRIVGKAIGLSPFWEITACLVGGSLFGILGLLLGVPIFAMVYFAIQGIVAYRLKKRGLPYETDAYRTGQTDTGQSET